MSITSQQMMQAKIKKHLAEGHHKTPFFDYIKEVVYGGIDGIITTFAVVAGFTGASVLLDEQAHHLPIVLVLLFGLANLLADGFSMGVGEFLSARAERKLYQKEYAREYQEIIHNTDFEEAESAFIFERKGFSAQDAYHLTEIYKRNPHFWAEFMMHYELNIPTPSPSPMKNALATFGAFIFFGIIPLMPYITGMQEYAFAMSALSAIGALVVLGIFRARITREHVVQSIAETLALGVVAGIIAYAVGSLF